MGCKLDHIVIGAATLEQGAAFVREQLGVVIPAGGVHESLGTHNLLMSLGDSVFLEVIARNPNHKSAAQPRWYGLDDPLLCAQLAAQPMLLTWVVNTADIRSTLAGAACDFGVVTDVSRGDLHWQFGLPHDGRLLACGMLPYLIQWQTDRHPASDMANTGCALRSLSIHHPYPVWLQKTLRSIDADELVTCSHTRQSPYLEVNISVPGGERTLRSFIPGS